MPGGPAPSRDAFGKLMRRFPPWQWRNRVNLVHIERVVEMWKEITTTRFFPLEREPHCVRLYRQEHETGAMGEMPARRFAQLLSIGEMNEAVAQVDRRTAKEAVDQ